MQKLAMQKTDFPDFTSRVKLLLELMTSNSVEESASSQAKKSRSSPDVSDSETDDSDEDHVDSEEYRENLKNEPDHDKAFHLKKFFKDSVENKRKVPPSTGSNHIWDSYKFEEMMYRVIPVRLDRRMNNSRKLLKRKATWQNE